MFKHICNCKEPSPEIVIQEQTNRDETKRRRREVEICVNCYLRTDKEPLTKWVVETING